MDSRSIAIETRRLGKTFGRQTVFKDVDLTVAEGEAVALCGANGAGKTTLLRCLAGVVRPSQGEVRWHGRPSAGSMAARRHVGWLGHESLLYPRLTLQENLLFAARMHGMNDARAVADRWLRGIGLARAADRVPSQVSRGMRQRVALARALIHQPTILLLDEPFSGLDLQGIQWLLELLSALTAKGCTLCFATHDPQITRRLADRVLMLRAGGLLEVRALGPSADTNSGSRAA